MGTAMAATDPLTILCTCKLGPRAWQSMHSERSWPACPRTHPCPWPVRRGRFLRLWYRDTITTAEQSEPDARKQIHVVNTTETVLDRKFGLTNTQILAILDRQRACNFDTKMASCVKMSDLDRTSTTLDQCSPRNRNV